MCIRDSVPSAESFWVAIFTYTHQELVESSSALARHLRAMTSHTESDVHRALATATMLRFQEDQKAEECLAGAGPVPPSVCSASLGVFQGLGLGEQFRPWLAPDDLKDLSWIPTDFLGAATSADCVPQCTVVRALDKRRCITNQAWDETYTNNTDLELGELFETAGRSNPLWRVGLFPLVKVVASGHQRQVVVQYLKDLCEAACCEEHDGHRFTASTVVECAAHGSPQVMSIHSCLRAGGDGFAQLISVQPAQASLKCESQVSIVGADGSGSR
eukprot:TRINITY_DN23144_c0_g1_i1.p1 TRINITY_DN23144_c0_g1~~TRINITY_DN23144_c0_g1_i1.p1  ORF type:complete len:273 (-),score=68.35 TRINITY_DN23144_c0_g1_i1:62-880(-)